MFSPNTSHLQNEGDCPLVNRNGIGELVATAAYSGAWAPDEETLMECPFWKVDRLTSLDHGLIVEIVGGSASVPSLLLKSGPVSPSK